MVEVTEVAGDNMSGKVQLSIDDFSCIKHARFELAPVTVLIGPQGSGKSVTTKLFYFFVDILNRHYSSAEKSIDLDDFKKETVRLFRSWFPPSAWGGKRFNIAFSAGLFTVRILRRTSKGKLADDVSVTFSDFFKTEYAELIETYEQMRATSRPNSRSLRRSTEGVWRVRERASQILRDELGDAYIESQTFVPAGRAHFTSIGRLVAAVDQGSSIDPVTVRFAKLFASLRDYANRGIRFSQPSREDSNKRREVMNQLFGGEIKFERDLEFVDTVDGRRVPFYALSSGQQELLPMWLLIDFYSDQSPSEKANELFYIEEPEAHLFPAAQSLLMDFLIGQLVSRRAKRNLVLTTHSPYILAKINNYLKAGKLGRYKRNFDSVAAIVPRECWLTPRRVAAYAIIDGTLENLMDNDGLIDGRYIDGVSDEVSDTYSRLLDVEFPETVAP